MTIREQYDRVYSSMVNGQRRQAISQADEMGMYEIPDMLDYFTNELNQPEMAIDFSKSYFRIKAK